MQWNGKSAFVPGPARKEDKRRGGKGIPVLALALLLLAPSGLCEDLLLGNFSAGDLSGWKPKVFQGKTSYTLVSEGERQVLKAESRKAASGLYKEVNRDPREFPVLRWSWKIESTILKGDGRTKDGDDYAARVYVVFPSILFFRTKAINYIWANRLPKGTTLPNAFSSNALMIAVESGDEKAGKWVTEERNVYEDYRTLFGEDPPAVIGAVALMTDTDNTGGETVAYYGDITLVGLSSP